MQSAALEQRGIGMKHMVEHLPDHAFGMEFEESNW